MPSKPELERLAAMANALRPDWPVRSVLTYLQADHAARAYTDVAVALAWVATDPSTVTPKRLSEAGPWWTTTTAARDASPVPRAGAPRCPVHDHEIATNCRSCRSEWLETGVWPDGTLHVDATRFLPPPPAGPDGRSLAAGEREVTP